MNSRKLDDGKTQFYVWVIVVKQTSASVKIAQRQIAGAKSSSPKRWRQIVPIPITNRLLLYFDWLGLHLD